MLTQPILVREGGTELCWQGKENAIALAGRRTAFTLQPDLPRSREPETTRNCYIEGDNVDALKLLREQGKRVGLIYTDPPYNTGNGGLPYRDGLSHAEWCSMLLPLLLLSRELLTPDGAILLYIDENEQASLQKLCEEVFGGENSLGTIVWDKRSPKGDARAVSAQHEYILAFARDKEAFLAKRRVRRPKPHAGQILGKAAQLYGQLGTGASLEGINRQFAAWLRTRQDFSGGERAYRKIDAGGEIYQAVSMAWPNHGIPDETYFTPLIHPVSGKPCPVPKRGWRYPGETMQRLLEQNLVLFGPDETTQPRRKYLLRDNLYESLPSLLYDARSDAGRLAALGIPFETPKVVDICMEHIRAFSDEDAVVLDFFAGSSTTAHAVMELNAREGSRRGFIMVQLPEAPARNSAAYRAGYATLSGLGMERIRRAGDDLRKRYPEAGLDDGFRVYCVK